MGAWDNETAATVISLEEISYDLSDDGCGAVSGIA